MKLWVGLILTTMVLGVMLLSGVVLAKKLVGGPGNNNYMGSNDTDYIYGGGGADDIGGKNGPDHLFGDKGNDRLHGGRGHDWVEGGPGSDTAWGDKGTDDLFAEREHKGSFQAAKVKGGRKPNRLLGGRGNDIIRAKNGKKDIIRGGPGYDKAYVDRVDKVKGVEKKLCLGTAVALVAHSRRSSVRTAKTTTATARPTCKIQVALRQRTTPRRTNLRLPKKTPTASLWTAISRS
jgi:hypothetical protein